RIGNSVHATCVLACTVLHETAAANALGSIKEIRFVDVKETIEQEIATQMKARFGTSGDDEAGTAGHGEGIWKYAKRAEEVGFPISCAVHSLSTVPSETKEILRCGNQS
ncbi:hypothetical protein OSTOST_16872, partial [Ostertagia ostertagi]